MIIIYEWVDLCHLSSCIYIWQSGSGDKQCKCGLLNYELSLETHGYCGQCGLFYCPLSISILESPMDKQDPTNVDGTYGEDIWVLSCR